MRITKPPDTAKAVQRTVSGTKAARQLAKRRLDHTERALTKYAQTYAAMDAALRR